MVDDMRTITTPEQLRAAVHEIPGSDGWWYTGGEGGEDTFNRLGEQLLQHGLSPAAAFEVLDTAYGAVAGEFGS